MPENMPQKMPEKMSEKMSDRMGHNIYIYIIHIYINKSPKAVLAESLPKVAQKRNVAEKP